MRARAVLLFASIGAACGGVGGLADKWSGLYDALAFACFGILVILTVAWIGAHLGSAGLRALGEYELGTATLWAVYIVVWSSVYEWRRDFTTSALGWWLGLAALGGVLIIIWWGGSKTRT